MIVKLTLDGHLQFDGSYEIEFSEDKRPFNNREFHWIKEVAGVTAGEFAVALTRGDTDLDVVMMMIAVVRAGKAQKTQFHQLLEFFMESDGNLTVDIVEDDAGPPASAETPQPEPSISSENKPSSSEGSNGTGDTHLELTQPFSGTPL